MVDDSPVLAVEPPPIDPAGEAALKLRRFIVDRIETLRLDLETDLGPNNTAIVRGRIMELRRVHRLITPQAAEEGTSSIY